MSKYVAKDLTGRKFGKLTALYSTNETNNQGCYKWVCRCECGNIKVVSTANLREHGGTQSCGCNKSNAVDVVSLREYEDRKRSELAMLNNGWQYVRCHDRSKGSHTVKCVRCGTEKTTRAFRDIGECSVCKRLAAAEQRERSKYKVCAWCGKEFKPQRNTALYCCERCSNAAYKERHRDTVREHWKISKRLREAKAKGNGKVDYSITLARLMERDNNICQLCGKEVDEKDYVYVGDVFIAGNNYPSIDHIKPLSKGGTHQWNNVQLAHRLCNSIKQDKER